MIWNKKSNDVGRGYMATYGAMFITYTIANEKKDIYEIYVWQYADRRITNQ